MKALDTNVIMRFLVRDDKQQADIVYRLFKRVEKGYFNVLPNTDYRCSD